MTEGRCTGVSLQPPAFSFGFLITGKPLFKAIGYKAMGCIIGGYAYLYPVSLYNLDPVFFHAAGKHPCDNDIIITLNFHGPPAHNPGHQALQFN